MNIGTQNVENNKYGMKFYLQMPTKRKPRNYANIRQSRFSGEKKGVMKNNGRLKYVKIKNS